MVSIALSTNPTYPVPGKIRVSWIPLSGNYARTWVTTAPNGSGFRKQLNDANTSNATSSRVLVHEGYTREEWQPTLEVPGKYSFSVQEYTRETDEGGYELDPRGAPTETKVSTEASLNIHVGARFEQTIALASGETATLAFHIFGEFIQETRRRTHGEDTPSVVATSSPRMALAAQSAAVLSALTDLAGATVLSAVGDIDAIIAEMATDVGAHMNSVTYHNAADNENSRRVTLLPTSNTLASGIVFAAQQLVTGWNGHVSNQPDGIHQDGSANVNSDTDSRLLAKSPTTVSEAMVALADIRRAWDLHRALTDPHKGLSDSTTLTATLGELMALHKAFLSSLEIGSTEPSITTAGAWAAELHGFGQADPVGAQ